MDADLEIASIKRSATCFEAADLSVVWLPICNNEALNSLEIVRISRRLSLKVTLRRQLSSATWNDLSCPSFEDKDDDDDDDDGGDFLFADLFPEGGGTGGGGGGGGGAAAAAAGDDDDFPFPLSLFFIFLATPSSSTMEVSELKTLWGTSSYIGSAASSASSIFSSKSAPIESQSGCATFAL